MLVGVPASHPSLAAELMLGHKGIAYERVDLVPAAHKLLLRLFGFPQPTVPALVTHGQRLQGTRTISRALDALEPGAPRLFPADPERRREVERAELWGDLVLQPAARRLAWVALRRDRSTIATYLEGARTGIPLAVAVRTAGPVAWASARLNRASDRSARRDLAALPTMLAGVDALIERGVLGGAQRNAADFQIATSLRLLMSFADLGSLIEGRPAGRLALEVVPRFAGRAGATFPADWIPDSVR